MIQSNLLVVFSLVLVMCYQVNFFFNSVLDKSTRKSNGILYFCFIIFSVLAFIYLVVPLNSVVSSMLAIVMIFSLAQSYRVDVKIKLIFTILYAVLMTIVNVISLYIFYVIDDIDVSIIDPTSEQAQLVFTKALLLSCIIMFAIIQIIRLIAKRRSFSIHYRYYIIFLIVPLISTYQLNVITSYSDKNIHYLLSIIGFLFINVGVIYIFDHMIEKFQFMHENAQLQQQMDYQDANYEKTVHSFKSIKRIIHDTNQQF